MSKAESLQGLQEILASYGQQLGGVRDKVVDRIPSVHQVVDHPLFNVAQMIPGVNIPANALSYGSHVARGDTTAAVFDAMSMIPGVRGMGMAGGKMPAVVDAMRDWGVVSGNLAKNYPSAVARQLSQIDSVSSMLESLRTIGRMTGRQVGNGMQVKQGADAVISPVNAAIYE